MAGGARRVENTRRAVIAGSAMRHAFVPPSTVKFAPVM